MYQQLHESQKFKEVFRTHPFQAKQFEQTSKLTAWQHDISEYWRRTQQMQDLRINPDHLSIRLQRSAWTHQLSVQILSFFNDCKVVRSHVNIGGGKTDNSKMIIFNCNRNTNRTGSKKTTTNMRMLSTSSNTNHLTCGHSNRSDYLPVRICLLQQKPAFQGSFWAHICLSKKNCLI